VKKSVWTKSTRSGNNGACVEVCDFGDGVGVRDSKDRKGPALSFTPAEWQSFLHGAKKGEFDL
jgi:hypothetical protein